MFVKVSPMRNVIRFGRKGKLSPRYVGPFQILDRVGTLAYRIALPPEYARIHNVFHVSQLRKYVADPSHVIAIEPVVVQDDLSYVERPLEILDTQEKTLRNKVIKLIKVRWTNHAIEEATWEKESEMKQNYPDFFA